MWCDHLPIAKLTLYYKLSCVAYLKSPAINIFCLYSCFAKCNETIPFSFCLPNKCDDICFRPLHQGLRLRRFNHFVKIQYQIVLLICLTYTFCCDLYSLVTCVNEHDNPYHPRFSFKQITLLIPEPELFDKKNLDHEYIIYVIFSVALF